MKKILEELPEKIISVPAGQVRLEGNLIIPEDATGIVVFAHGSGSSRHSIRNRFVAGELGEGNLATLLFDLLSPEEESIDIRTTHLRFDIALLAQRLIFAVDWIAENEETSHLRVGLFGSSTGAGAALVAAAQRRDLVGAVVSRGGRPDLAGSALNEVEAPTLFIVGQNDTQVIELNHQAMAQLHCEKKMEIIPRASHLFEEPGALEDVAQLAREWFEKHLED